MNWPLQVKDFKYWYRYWYWYFLVLGKWIVRLRKGLASRCWENLIMAMLGEQFMVGEEVCGAVVSIRYQVKLTFLNFQVYQNVKNHLDFSDFFFFIYLRISIFGNGVFLISSTFETLHNSEIMSISKVQLFWEDCKNLELFSTWFDVYQLNSKFLGHLRKAEH